MLQPSVGSPFHFQHSLFREYCVLMQLVLLLYEPEVTREKSKADDNDQETTKSQPIVIQKRFVKFVIGKVQE
jgi:hypothetical protein